VLVAIFVKLLISQKEISKFVILDRKQLVNVRPKIKIKPRILRQINWFKN
jgi:hypothetical protein